MVSSDRAQQRAWTAGPGAVTAIVEVVTAPPQWFPGGLRLLDEVERARLDRLRPPLVRAAYLTRHVLARLVLGEQTGTPPEALRFTRDCATCDRQHGKPRLVGESGDPHPPVAFNLSGTTRAGAAARFTTIAGPDSVSGSGLVAVAVLTGLTGGGESPAQGGVETAVGVDLETVAAIGAEGFDEVALHPLERAALEGLPPTARPAARAVWWARKESVVKALGVGLRLDPATLATTPPGDAIRWLDSPDLPRLAVTDLYLDLGVGLGVGFRDGEPMPGPVMASGQDEAVVGAVCVLGADRVRVVHRSGAALLAERADLA